MIAGSLLLGRALAPIDLMVGSWSGFLEAKNQFNRLRTLLTAYPDDIERMSLPAPTGQLSVENITVIPPGSQIAAVRGGFPNRGRRIIGHHWAKCSRQNKPC